VPVEHCPQVAGQSLGADGTREQGRDGHADLDSRQEPVGVLRQPRRPLAPLALPGQRAHLAVPKGNQGHLGGCEEAADKNDDQDNENVPADGIHV